MPPSPSLLDFTQILQRVFDEANGRLRTDAQATVVAGSLEVIISHTDDSIRLGDGTSLITATTVGPKVGLDVNVVNQGVEATTQPFVANVQVLNANIEVSYNVPDNTKVLFIRPRNGSIKLAFVSGQSGTTYLTINKGGVYTVDNINSSGAVLYFQSSTNNDVVEIHGWNV
jgi:hypothetical protein